MALEIYFCTPWNFNLDYQDWLKLNFNSKCYLLCYSSFTLVFLTFCDFWSSTNLSAHLFLLGTLSLKSSLHQGQVATLLEQEWQRTLSQPWQVKIFLFGVCRHTGQIVKFGKVSSDSLQFSRGLSLFFKACISMSRVASCFRRLLRFCSAIFNDDDVLGFEDSVSESENRNKEMPSSVCTVINCSEIYLPIFAKSN